MKTIKTLVELQENLKKIDNYLKKCNDTCWDLYDCSECCNISNKNCGSYLKDLIEERHELLNEGEQE